MFHEAKDNRLLPRGFKTVTELGCETNPDAGTKIFGIPQCSAAGATEPQFNPLTLGSAIASDKHYTDSTMAGSDAITYQIANMQEAASIRVTLQYQTIPPAYLASRIVDGYDST